jgi:hypothetical protein
MPVKTENRHYLKMFFTCLNGKKSRPAFDADMNKATFCQQCVDHSCERLGGSGGCGTSSNTFFARGKSHQQRAA